jgi:hypothetical protein
MITYGIFGLLLILYYITVIWKPVYSLNMIITELLTQASLGDEMRDQNNQRLDALQKKSFGRVLTSLGWAGDSGAAADGELEFFEDLVSLYRAPNIAADSVLNRDLIVGLEAYIPSRHAFNFECVDAMADAGVIHMSFLEQRPGESLVGKIQGAETTLFEPISAMTLNQGLGMEETKTLSYHKIDEENDRFLSFVTLLGSTAINDSGICFTVDGDFRGSLYNVVSVTKALRHNSWMPANIYIPKGSEFDFYCHDAFAAAARIGLKILTLTESRMAAQVEAAKPEEV